MIDAPPLPPWRKARHELGQRVRSLTNVHRPSGEPNVLLFSTPRGGSTWLFELIGSQPGFKGINEPLNLRLEIIREATGIDRWTDLYDEGALGRLEPYFRGLADGSLRHMNQNPWTKNYRPRTSRAVFKVLHGAEHLAPQLADAIGAKVAVLLRHPLAVALSRTVLPRFDAYFEDAFLSSWMNERQRREALAIRDDGDDLARSVLSWCMQVGPLLRHRTDDWLVVSYEQMVVDGSPVIARAADRLALPDPGHMLALLHRPSTSIRGMSTRATVQKLDSRPSEARSLWLVSKWRDRIDADAEARAMSVLERLEIDAYRAGSVFPADAYWVDLRKSS